MSLVCFASPQKKNRELVDVRRDVNNDMSTVGLVTKFHLVWFVGA